MDIGDHSQKIKENVHVEWFKDVRTGSCYSTDLHNSGESCGLNLSGMANLKKIFLKACGNKIVLKEMDILRNLDELFILDNALVKTPLSKMPNIEKLFLFNCGLENDFEDRAISVHGLTKLKRLVVFNCRINKCPKGLEELSELEHLDLSKNNLSDCLRSMPVLPKLKVFTAYEAEITDLPVNLDKMTSLIGINLTRNRNIDDHDRSLKIPQLLELKVLILAYCDLKRIPLGIGWCTDLEELDLRENHSLGLKDIRIPRLEKLRKIHLWNCGLQGIPGGIKDCTGLEELNLSDNESLGIHTVTIPELNKLVYLRLRNCGLSVVPEGICSLGNLNRVIFREKST